MQDSKFSPNAVESCPSPARLKTHRAHGVICAVCEPDEERRDRCPECWRQVPVIGVVVQPHTTRVDGWLRGCPGVDRVLPLAAAVERQILRDRPAPKCLQRALALVGGA